MLPPMLRALLAALCLLLAAPVQAQALTEGIHYEFKPSQFLGHDKKVELIGPEKAKGLVIWTHGRGDDDPGDKAPTLALYFAKRGWDVYTLYRYRGHDTNTSGYQMLALAIEKAKALGYQRIVPMGESAGAYASLEAVRNRTDIFAIVALAPAGFGSAKGKGANSGWRQNDSAMRPMWEKTAGTTSRIVAAYFAGDEFFESEQPNVRGPWLQQTLTQLGVANYVIDQPAHPMLTGHNAGATYAFGMRYGPCVYIFIETGVAPPCEDNDPAALATFSIVAPPRLSILPGASAAPQLGLWFGATPEGRMRALAVESIDDKVAKVKFILGHGVDPADPTGGAITQSLTLTVGSNALSYETQQVKYDFRLQKDGQLLVERILKAIGPIPKTFTLRRLD